MYRRVVFVGLGGSGGKTLRFLKRDLRHWLTEHNWPESRGIPEGFQFRLALDHEPGETSD